MYLLFSIFILFLSLNVCTARSLVAVEEASSFTDISISGKVCSENDMKQPLESNGTKKIEPIKVKNNNGAVREQSSKHMKKVNLKKGLESTEKQKVSGFVSVSWHVPHIKQDQNPGFHLDYSRPRTRPPSHN